MTDNEMLAAITGGAAGVGGGGFGLWKRRKARRLERARAAAKRLFPHAKPEKLAREVHNLLRKIK